MNAVLGYLRRLAAVESCRNEPDQELLARFVHSKDESAFCALLERHGPMVLGVCRRVLRREQDAEDALQATFLVFVRKAGSIRKGCSLRSWLYGVAYRIASKSRAQLARQRLEEAAVAERTATPSADEPSWREVQSILDEELRALADKYRDPILLCCLEGKSRDEAARQLGCKEGAVKIHLERGRELLRRRLAQRGIALSAGLASTLLASKASAALPVRTVASLVEASLSYSTGQAAVGATSTAIALAEGMLQSMNLVRITTIASVFLVVLVGVGTAALGHSALSGRPEPARPAAEATVSANEKPKSPPGNQLGPPAIEEAEEKEGPTLAGVLRAVDERQQVVTLRVKETEADHSLSLHAKIVIDGKDARLSDLKPASRIRATLTADGRRIARIVASGRVVSCPVHSVDAMARTVTVHWKGDSRTRPRTFAVRADAVIRLDGELAQLGDLAPEMLVELQLSVDERTVLTIAAKRN